jgi:hypothetical protein
VPIDLQLLRIGLVGGASEMLLCRPVIHKRPGLQALGTRGGSSLPRCVTPTFTLGLMYMLSQRRPEA